MRIIKVLGAVTALSAMAIAQAEAADLSPAEDHAQCVGTYRSALLDQSRPEVDDAVNRMYERALFSPGPAKRKWLVQRPSVS